MCDVCDEHNAYGLKAEDEDLIKCHECGDRINPYEEKVHVWTVYDPKHPTGARSVFLCPGCNAKRSGKNWNVS